MIQAETTIDYARVEKAIRFIEQNFQEQPDLKAVADYIGLSEYHFQRLFTRWAGISPKRFIQFLTIQHAKQLLRESKSILETTYDSGLSSPGRLHDLFVTHEAVTPGEYKRRGAGSTITYGFHSGRFGDCLIGLTPRGICHLSFVEQEGQALDDLFASWPQANLVEDVARTRPLVEAIFAPSTTGGQRSRLNLHLKGTNFQIRVWQALLRIPQGRLVSYGTMAQLIGRPNASRAIGAALGANPVAYLIPCHRVIRSTGAFGDYRWGATRKKAIIGWEAAQLLPFN